MFKKLISCLLITSLCIQFAGCYSYQKITKEEFINAKEYKDIQVTTKNEYIYEFDEGNYIVDKDSIYGRFIDRRIKKAKYKDFTGSIYLPDIEKIKFDEFDAAVTILGVAVIVGLIVLIVANIKPSFEGFGGSGSGNAL